MSGGSPSQQNIAYYELSPPLYKIWDYDIEGGVGFNGIAAADAVLFVNSLAGEMVSLDITTGGKIGTVGSLGKDASTTPLVMGNYLILTFAGDDKYSMVAYDLIEGSKMWRKNFGYIQTSPVLYNHAVYFGTLNGNEYKIEDSTGKVLWKFFCGEPIHSTCAASGNRVIFGTDKGSLICLNTDTGMEAWKFKITAPIFSTPMIHNNNVYFGADDSNYYSINIESGSVAWKNNLKTKITGGSALFKDSLAVFGGINGVVYAVNKNSGEVVWSFLTYGTITSTPLACGSYIYVTSFDSHVYCLDGTSGSLVWKFLLENKSRTTPVVWKDYLFVAADRSIYCFTDKIVEKTK